MGTSGEAENVNFLKTDEAAKVKSLLEIDISFTGEADDDVGAQRQIINFQFTIIN